MISLCLSVCCPFVYINYHWLMCMENLRRTPKHHKIIKQTYIKNNVFLLLIQIHGASINIRPLNRQVMAGPALLLSVRCTLHYCYRIKRIPLSYAVGQIKLYFQESSRTKDQHIRLKSLQVSPFIQQLEMREVLILDQASAIMEQKSITNTIRHVLYIYDLTICNLTDISCFKRCTITCL